MSKAVDAPWWALRYEAMAGIDPGFAGVVDSAAEAQVDLVQRLLSLTEGDRILDVGCGGGRHAILFQERGFEVTGVDLSPRILRLARENWEARNQGRRGPTWMPGDMRWLPASGPFDAAVLMDHAFGVFDDDADHLRTLTAIIDQLRADGRVVCELLNPYYWAHHNVTRHHPPGSMAEDMDVVRTYRFDAQRGRVEDRVVVLGRGGRHELPVQSLRCWTPVELVSLFKAAGFRKVTVSGSDGWEVPEEPLPVHPEESVFLWVVAEI
ncbi:MAG: methyltransferase domain-containing protein [Pseudomonadota bacterium]|nr:methyltransferase domain-containing protein [Pseudomonadota bacterium]